jgi:hypothetical protein
MVIHYPPARLRRHSDQPTAITDVLVAASPGSRRTGDIPLAMPTSSARTRHGLWALYPKRHRGRGGLAPGGPWPDRPPRPPTRRQPAASTSTSSLK